MAVKIKDRVTADGVKFQKTLEELKRLQVRIGIQQMDSDGQGKYDGEKIYAKGGVRDETGKIVDSKVSLLDIAMWNELGTERIKPRPFLRNSVDAHEEEINSFLQSMTKRLAKGASAEDVLKKIGSFQKGLIQKEIANGHFEKNTDSTIRKKGSDRPLIDTGRMRQSINYVIREKGSGDD